MDGWGGALTQAIRISLTADSSRIALALGLAKREPRVGHKFQRRGDYMLRAAGAGLAPDYGGEPETPYSSVLIAREAVALSVCVQDSEDADPLNLIPIAETFARIALRAGHEWIDPSFEFNEVVYSEESEHPLIAESGFVMSMRVSYKMAVFA